MLEPSPPAVRDAPWFADDPAAVGEVRTGLPVVAPTTAGDITWDELASEDPMLAAWCADRWLGAWRRLSPPPHNLGSSVRSLHAVAEYVLAPARYEAVGRIGQRYTRGGFGTPFLPDDRQLRVDTGGLHITEGGHTRSVPFTTLADLGKAVGIEPGAVTELYRPETEFDPHAALHVGEDAAFFLGEFFGFSASVLEQLRAEADPSDADSTRVQIWPEHFDMAIELGDEAAGGRAAIGASPGDANHEGPYFYVAPWAEVAPDPYWDAKGFAGAHLLLADLTDVDDQRDVVLEFYRRGRSLLSRSED